MQEAASPIVPITHKFRLGLIFYHMWYIIYHR